MIKGTCPICGLEIDIEEMPANYAFLVAGRYVDECPQCEELLTYAGVTGQVKDKEED